MLQSRKRAAVSAEFTQSADVFDRDKTFNGSSIVAVALDTISTDERRERRKKFTERSAGDIGVLDGRG
jgi:hypothetical protein